MWYMVDVSGARFPGIIFCLSYDTYGIFLFMELQKYLLLDLFPNSSQVSLLLFIIYVFNFQYLPKASKMTYTLLIMAYGLTFLPSNTSSILLF